MAFKKDSDPIKDMSIGASLVIRTPEDLSNLDLDTLSKLKEDIQKSRNLFKIYYVDSFLSDYPKSALMLLLENIKDIMQDKENEETLNKFLETLNKFKDRLFQGYYEDQYKDAWFSKKEDWEDLKDWKRKNGIEKL